MNGVPPIVRTRVESSYSTKGVGIVTARRLVRLIDSQAEEITRLKCRIKTIEYMIERKNQLIDGLVDRCLGVDQ